MAKVVEVLDRESVVPEEPIGIVISRGGDVESVPRFRAYFWAEASQDEVEVTA
jgi:hypothetical protein